eukprot:356057-Chlamydomonas_euryale.AAC.5
MAGFFALQAHMCTVGTETGQGPSYSCGGNVAVMVMTSSAAPKEPAHELHGEMNKHHTGFASQAQEETLMESTSP